MARASSQYLSDDAPPSRGEWSELKSELTALLDQVESQVTRSKRNDPDFSDIAERMRDLRLQVAEGDDERAVARRQIERDDAPVARATRDHLESAIQQIRSRHFAREEETVRRTPDPGPRFEEMARSVTGITDKLQRLETELKTQSRGQSANIKEIADQVGQLSHVVELLAGAVGETGQVKRLEGQIAALAKLITQEQQTDASAITRRLDDVAATVAGLVQISRQQAAANDVSAIVSRLDDVTATVGRLADLQGLLTQRADTSGLATRLDDVTQTVGRLADLQVQFADRSNTGALEQRIAEVNGTINRLAEMLEKPATNPETEIFSRRLDDMTSSVARIADIQAKLADRTDTTSLGKRIDEVTLTVGKLADLQVQVAQIVDNPRDGVREGMSAIEDGIRAIYDRIDALEQSVALPASEIDRLTDQLGKITAALRAPQPQGLIELVDALNTRISDLEGRNGAVTPLHADVDALRDVVHATFEPRFSALEQRLGDIAERLAERPVEASTAQLEAQVRQLVARMDQTGEQLSGLARLYQQPVAEAPLPDLEELADRVAERTMALQRLEPLPPNAVPDFDELERRIGAMIEAQATLQQTEGPDAETDRVAIRATIEEVNERLRRLEEAIAARPVDAGPLPITPLIDPAPQAAATQTARSMLDEGVRMPLVPERPHADPLAPLIWSINDEEALQSKELRQVADYQRDAMPVPPDADAPLIDRPFVDPVPSAPPTPSVGKASGRTRHPGLEDAELPPPPKSSLEADFDEAFARSLATPEPASRPSALRQTVEPVVPTVAEPQSAAEDVRAAEQPAAPSRADYISALRRSAREASEKKHTALGGNSLIGRAFARINAQTSGIGEPIVVADTAGPRAEKPKSALLQALQKAKPEKVLAGDKPVPQDRKRKGQRALAAAAAESVAIDEQRGPVGATENEAVDGGSLLLRYKRPIILIVGFVILASVALNFLNQYLARHDSGPTAVPAVEQPATQKTSDASDATLVPVPLADQKDVPVTQPRIIPNIDTIQTGSIAGTQAQSFAPASTVPAPTTAFQAATSLANASPTDTASLSSDVKPLANSLDAPLAVDMPPESVGPLELRQAAANGDARAQFEVAAIYTEGRAVPEDLSQAAVWYERAASKGFAPAQYRLGNLFENGKGVERDLDQARLWYQQAAEAGNRMAMHNLAALYASGNLGSQQFDAAAKWFEEAARRGLKDSQFNLGMLYARGLGVKQDLAMSYKWFGIAARRGDADAAKAQNDIAASLDAATVQKVNAEIAGFHPEAVDLAANFAPIGTWQKDFNPGTQITQTGIVKQVQEALMALGFDVGTPDGVAGDKTKVAIRDFERATGMSESGSVNPRLLAVLGSQPV